MLKASYQLAMSTPSVSTTHLTPIKSVTVYAFLILDIRVFFFYN